MWGPIGAAVMAPSSEQHGVRTGPVSGDGVSFVGFAIPAKLFGEAAISVGARLHLFGGRWGQPVEVFDHLRVSAGRVLTDRFAAPGRIYTHPPASVSR